MRPWQGYGVSSSPDSEIRREDGEGVNRIRCERR